MEHYSFSKGLAEWYAKHNRYSSDEAHEAVARTGDAIPWGDLASGDRTRRRRALKAVAARMPFRPALRFLYMYVLRLGALDGRAGLEYCRLLATYEAMTVAKEREIRLRERGVPI